MELKQGLVFNQVTLDEMLEAISDVLDKKLEKLQPPVNDDDFITRKEAASILGISLNTLNTHTLNSTIKGYRLGKSVRYKRSELQHAFKSINSN
jgi:excisionase family DNA binding protein